MRKSLLLATIAVFALFSCKKKDNTPSNSANLMFVHACAPGATPINVDGKVSGTSVAGATNISFLKNSGYKPVTAASGLTISFAVTGLAQLCTGTGSLAVGSSYTAFAGGNVTAPSLLFTTDDLSAPTAGNAKIRFVNLCADGLSASCYVGATKLDSNVSYMKCTPYYTVAATTAKVAMIDQVVLTNSAQLINQNLVAGKIYTYIFTGSSTGSGTSSLMLTMIANN